MTPQSSSKNTTTQETPLLIVQRLVTARLPTQFGDFQLCAYENNRDRKEHLAIVKGDLRGREGVLARVHSECFTGDVLGSLRCDCGPQLDEAMRQISVEGSGIIVYMRQEGRGIGLIEKLKAYNLQDDGMDTVDANLALGHAADARDYSIAVEILRDWGVKSVRLLTNNPDKVESLERLGMPVTQRLPIETAANPNNVEYLHSKALRMRHILKNGYAAPARHAGHDE
jgi:3,4-dihydroxy 2-butanone 4-phosphate synthase/GTP cyclohydrolase II